MTDDNLYCLENDGFISGLVIDFYIQTFKYRQQLCFVPYEILPRDVWFQLSKVNSNKNFWDFKKRMPEYFIMRYVMRNIGLNSNFIHILAQCIITTQ